MKKLSVLFLAAAVALGASAGVNFKASHAMKKGQLVNPEMTKMNPKSLKAKAEFRAPVTEQPEGEVVTYDRAGSAVYISGSSIYAGQQSGRTDVVYAEDGKVYIKNIIYGSGEYFGDSWVEGTIEGNEIHVPMGQSIYYSDYYGADVVLGMGSTYVEDASIYYTLDDRATEAVYVIDGNTLTLQGTYDNPTGSDYPAYEGYGLLCYWSDDASFGGFNEWNTVLTEHIAVEAPELITEIPEGCQVYTYRRNSSYISNSFFGIGQGETDGVFVVAFDTTTGDVYVQNPAWYHDYNNTWVKGSYDWMTGMITIPTGQFLSWSADYEYGVVLGWGSTYVYEDGVDEYGDPAYYLGTELDTRTTEIQMMIDDDYLYLLGTEGNIYAEFPDSFVATGMYTYYSDDESMTSIEFCNRDEYGYAAPFGIIKKPATPAVPANPTADEWYDCGDESGFSKFYFTLPEFDVDGNYLEEENLSYALWINDGFGEIYQFTFPAEDYTFDLYNDIDEVPYDIYSNAVDFRDYFVYMYRTNMNDNPLFVRDEEHNGNIGIQVFYTVDGVKNASDIVWLYEVPSAVNELNAGKTVANVRYFNVAGQEMAQPSGMTIKVTTYTDGTTSTAKVVK